MISIEISFINASLDINKRVGLIDLFSQNKNKRMEFICYIINIIAAMMKPFICNTVSTFLLYKFTHSTSMFIYSLMGVFVCVYVSMCVCVSDCVAQG